MAVTTQTLRAVEQLRRTLQSLTDAQTVALTAAWVQAWDAVLPEFEAAIIDLVNSADPVTGRVPSAVVARNVRLRGALQAIRAHLDVLAPQSADIMVQDLTTVMFESIEGHAAVVTSQLPPATVGGGVGFARVPEEALAAIVQRTTEQIHASTRPLPADVEAAMKRHLVRGIAVGENPKRTAAKLIKETESRFNGGLNRALVISRTEMLDAHRAATKVSEQANTDVLTMWEWNAKLDTRTCPSCLSKHGNRYELTDDGPLDHQQGRCARVSVTKSWKELGFDIEEPPSSTPDAKDWFDSLDEVSQLEIMGRERLDLLNSGAIQWKDLSTKRETDGWRTSYGVTPLKNLRT